MKRTPFPRDGVLVALALPTDARGRLMKRALGAHLAWLRDRGIHGVLALGSTGDFVRFSVDERKAILDTVVELAGPLPVIANISDVDARIVVELGRHARRLRLPGVAVMPPHFFPVSPADQLAWFTRAAEAAQLPVLLYNFPELTGNRIAAETIAAFADRAPMAGIKQSGAEFDYHRELIALGQAKDFSVFSGADTRLTEVFALGARGCIGGLVNFVPEYMLEIFRVVREGRPGDTQIAAERMRAVGRVLPRLNFPLNVTAGIAARGLEPGVPKVPVSPESAHAWTGMVTEFRELFAQWKLPPAGAVSPASTTPAMPTSPVARRQKITTPRARPAVRARRKSSLA